MEKTNPYTDKLNRWSSHYQIARMIKDLPMSSKVLDVGAGSGTLARICDGRGYIFYGIEPNAGWLGNTRSKYTGLFEGNLEDTPEDFIQDFDAVICGDIIEHLMDPEKQLSRLISSQRKDCIFIISVPNIANLWVRVNLLIGRFDYSEKGILDKTHLHFFTMKSFRKLLMNAGLHINEFIPTPIPLDLAIPRLNINLLIDALFALLLFLTNLWPTLFAYQWIAKATKYNISNGDNYSK